MVKGKSDVDVVAIVPGFNPAAMATYKQDYYQQLRKAFPDLPPEMDATRTRRKIGSCALLGDAMRKLAKEANYRH